MTRYVEPQEVVMLKNRTRIFYRLWEGDGKCITLINGFMRSSSDFRLLAKHLNGAGYRVLALDNRGSGRTEVEDSFSIQDMAEDVLSIWDDLRVHSSFVLGISMGGLIAQELLQVSPEALMGLILVSTCRDPKGVLDSRLWPMDVNLIYENLTRYVTPRFVEGNALLIKTMAQMMLKEMQENAYQDRSLLQRKALESFVPLERTSKIGCPVRILHGAEDRVIPVKYAWDLKNVFDSGEVKIFPNVGHLLLAECPKDFAEDCLDSVNSWA